MPAATSVQELVSNAQGGDVQATNDLFNRFQPLVTRVIRKYGTSGIGDDLTGESFLAFARLVERYDPTRGLPFPHYVTQMLPVALHTIVRRQYRVELREVSLKWEDESPFPAAVCPPWATGGARSPWTSPGDPATETESRLLLRQLLSTLNRRQAYVFFQRAVAGHPFAEIAQTLGSTSGSVRVTYHLARQRLKTQWRKLFPEDA